MFRWVRRLWRGGIDTRKFPEAVFTDKEKFPHWDNPDDASFIGHSRMLRVRPVAWTERWVLIPATILVDGVWRVIPEAYNLWSRIPGEAFPLDWQECRREAEKSIPYVVQGDPYNYSENYGEEAGQTVRRAHAWYYPRGRKYGESPRLASWKKGAVGVFLLIKEGRIR